MTASKQFRYHTVSKRILGDLLTPVSVYMKMRDLSPQSALMESSDYHGSENSKSFISAHPIASVSISHGIGIIKYPDGTSESHPITKEMGVAQLINRFLDAFTISGEKSEVCGLWGYTSFNAVRYFEDIPVKDETQSENDAPDVFYQLYRDTIIFDHFRNELVIMQLLPEGDEGDLAQLERVISNAPMVRPFDFHPVGECTSTLTDDQHRENIRKGIMHC
ncbi:MAG: anthranilate synthase component I family protein, partial [Paraprevotella sp.]|nr:anthranilate synthase component I family protein [Paraprevotella sp.]